MMISTRGRYSIRILLDIAEHSTGDYIPMKEVAERQGISLKYIEKMMPDLKKGGLVDSTHGIRGGYRLLKTPEDITLFEILTLAEGDLAPVACLQKDSAVCERSAECKTLPIWEKYYELTKNYFSGITLADVAGIKSENNFVI